MDPINFLTSVFLLSATTAGVLLAAGVIGLFWLASHFCKSWLIPRLCRITERLPFHALHILVLSFAKPIPVMIRLLGICTALPILPFASIHAPLTAFCNTATQIVILSCVSWGFWNATDLCELAMNNVSAHLDLKASATLLSVLKKTYRVLVVIFALVAVLDALHYPVTGLITGFGLAGLTVSLAAQDSASNLFSGLMILLERPFSIGDWITVNGVDGEVEDLTFRSTKIRALDNSLYVLPNASVTSATINNGSTRTKRLFRFHLNLTYDSPRASLESLMSRLAHDLKQNPVIDPDSVLVRLTGFNESGVNILVSAYVMRQDLDEFLDVQNQLNLDILDLVRDEGLRFAMTASRVLLENETETSADR